jgi:hypothetical protein
MTTLGLGESQPILAGTNPAVVRAHEARRELGAWARSSGFEVGTRGRLYRHVFDACAAAHPED